MISRTFSFFAVKKMARIHQLRVLQYALYGVGIVVCICAILRLAGVRYDANPATQQPEPPVSDPPFAAALVDARSAFAAIDQVPSEASPLFGELAALGFRAPRNDLRCGKSFAMAGCDRTSVAPCCSKVGWCGASSRHCSGSHAHDHRDDVAASAALLLRGGERALRASPQPAEAAGAAAIRAALPLRGDIADGVRTLCTARGRCNRPSGRGEAAPLRAVDPIIGTSWRAQEQQWRELCPRVTAWWERASTSGRAPVVQRAHDAGLGDRLRSTLRAFMLAYVTDRPLGIVGSEHHEFDESVVRENLIKWRAFSASDASHRHSKYDRFHSANAALDHLFATGDLRLSSSGVTKRSGGGDARAISIQQNAYPWQNVTLDRLFWNAWHNDPMASARDRRDRWRGRGRDYARPMYAADDIFAAYEAPIDDQLNGVSEIIHLNFCILRALFTPAPEVLDALDRKMRNTAKSLTRAWETREHMPSKLAHSRVDATSALFTSTQFVSIQMRFGGNFEQTNGHHSHDPRRAVGVDLEWGIECALNFSATSSSSAHVVQQHCMDSRTVLILASDHADRLWTRTAARLSARLLSMNDSPRSSSGGMLRRDSSAYGATTTCQIMEVEGSVGHIYKDAKGDTVEEYNGMRKRVWLDWFLLAEAHECVFVNSGFALSACAASLRRQQSGGRIAMHDVYTNGGSKQRMHCG